MCVAPGFQNQGIGSRLVERGLELLAEQGCPFVVVLGHPEFYARFGFEPALGWGITCEFPGIPDDVFRIKLLLNRPQDLPKGTAKYRGEFSSAEEPRTK
jgi:putative acetyltransferase